MDKAPGAVFFTAAFGVNDLFTEVLANHKDYLRCVLLESPAKEMDRITKDRLNKVALAGTLGSGKFERWMREQNFRMLVKKFNQSDPATGKRGFLAPDDSPTTSKARRKS